MKKYKVINGQWIWNDRIDPDLLYDINDKDTMYQRGKYLTEVIDTLPNKSTFHDIEELPNGKAVVSYGPSSGKTTAIRQFILKSIDKGIFGVFATKLRSDIDSLYFDIVSQYFYLKGNNPLTCSITKFHSKSKIKSIDELRKSYWILCTHERLFIEPPSLIMTMDTTLISGMIQDPYDLYRDYILIDEYPTNLYKSVDVYDVSASLELLRYYLNIDETTSEVRKNILINAFMHDAYKNKINNPKLLYIINNLPNLIHQSYDVDMKRGLDDVRTELSMNRIGFFTNLFMSKLMKYDQKDDSEKSKNDKLYYSILDLICRNMYIFDGTGDIIFRGNHEFKLVHDDRFSRKLQLKSLNQIRIRSNRRHPIEIITSEFSSILDELCKKHSTESLLVYTWMNSKNAESSNVYLSDSIRRSMHYSDQVEFIYYNSGSERVTSEYVDTSVLVILGKFLIPNSTISEINNVIGTDLTTHDYTKSLIIQAIYRTAARIDKPITLYFSSDYSEEFIRDILSEFDELSGNTEIIHHEFDSSSYLLPDDSILSLILNSELGEFIDDYYEIDSKNLSSLLDLTKVDNSNIKNKLDRYMIQYEFISNKGGRNKSASFRIYYNNSSHKPPL